MNLFLLLIIVSVFAYFACNLGASKKPGHTSYGFTPVLWVVIVVIIGWIAWPVIGPFVSALLFHLGGVQ